MTDTVTPTFSTAAALTKLRNTEPLVQCVTNVVAAGFTANVLLALGASPAMVDFPSDSAAFAQVADAVLINFGTITAAQIEATKAITDTHPQWVFDPVGISISSYRTQLFKQLSAKSPTIIRGNASEIMALAGNTSGGKGMDTTDGAENALASAIQLAKQYSTTVAISGPTDIITNGDATIRVEGGSPLLTKVTGTGCSLGAVMAAFLPVTAPLEAAVSATSIYNAASEMAATRASGPGTFAAAFIDALAATDTLIEKLER